MKKKYLFASMFLGLGLLVGGLSIGMSPNSYIEAHAASGTEICSWTAPTTKPADSTAGKAAFTNGWSASSYTAWYSDGVYKLDKVDTAYVQSANFASRKLKDIDINVKAKASGSSGLSTLKVCTYNASDAMISDQTIELTKSYPSSLYQISFHEASDIAYVRFTMGTKEKGSNIYFASAKVLQGTAKIDPNSVTIDHETLTIKEFESSKLTATLAPAGASGSIEWTSSTPAVATIDEQGNIKALKEGTTTITAKVSGTTISDTCVVSVSKNTAQRYSLVKSLSDVNVGGEYIITDTNKNVALGAFEKTYATQSDILYVGDEVIQKTTGAQILTLGGEHGAYTLFNKATSKYLKSSLSTTENELLGSDNLVDGAYWDISEINPATSVATIKANTTIPEAKNWLRYNATSTRFACYGSGQGDILLFKKVTPQVASVSINEESQTLSAGETLQLSATILPAEALQSVTWISDNAAVAKVNADTGLVTAISDGVAHITATSPEDGSKASTITITVTSNPIVSLACANIAALPTQYIGESFDPSGLKFEVTRQDGLTYPVDNADISYKLFEGTSEKGDLIVSEATSKVVATLTGTTHTTTIEFTPVINKIYEFNKLTDVAQLTPGARVIITNNAPTLKAISTKQGNYNRDTTAVSATNDKISIKFTELEDTPIAIFDVEKGKAAGTFAFYDGRCIEGQGYLGFHYSAKGGHFNTKTYVELTGTNRDWTIALHTDNTIKMSSISEGTTGYLNINDKATDAGAEISAVADEHVNIYVYNPTVEEKLLAWGHNHVMMDDPEFVGDGTGKCRSTYGPSKKVLNDLGSEVISTLQDAKDGELLAIKARYEAWARANKDATPYDGLAFTPSQSALINKDNSSIIIIIVAISILSISLITFFAISKKKRLSK